MSFIVSGKLFHNWKGGSGHHERQERDLTPLDKSILAMKIGV